MTEKSRSGSSEDRSRFAALQNERRDLRKQSWEHQRFEELDRSVLGAAWKDSNSER